MRSERRFFEEVHLNLSHRWLCRLVWVARTRIHSTFRRTRTAALARATSCVICRDRRRALLGRRARGSRSRQSDPGGRKLAALGPQRERNPYEVREKAGRAARECRTTLDNATFWGGFSSNAEVYFAVRSSGPANADLQESPWKEIAEFGHSKEHIQESAETARGRMLYSNRT
jgi:hypothetical protein